MEIKIFEKEEFGKIRTLLRDGEPWFAGKDIAEIMQYSNPQKALRDHVDDEDKLTERIVLSGQNRTVIFINESGLYSLILSSKMPKAKEFKHWITSEVLPTIRKTGGYVNDADKFVDCYLSFADEPIKNLFKLQFKYIEQLQKRIEQDKPLVDFANQVADTSCLIDMNKMTKLAGDAAISIGRNKLYEFLRKMNVLMSNNIPYQRYIDRGYFSVKESVFAVGSVNKVYQQTFVTGKGQRFVITLLKKYFYREEN